MSQYSHHNQFPQETTNLRWGVRSKHLEQSNPEQFTTNIEAEEEIRLKTEQLIENQR